MPSFHPDNPVLRHKPSQRAGKNDPPGRPGESFLLAYTRAAAARSPQHNDVQVGTEDAKEKVS
ncbi:hypothetical protein [Citrobacter sp. Res13-Sevr-PEB04-36]|uniref:hypothetical protein n=1 Tax=Citrobacter sp. Res13-Sevr-PEB04-36 TaxID=2777960 RepID=UPI0018ACB164|nr:hypothetical protein [Citrobacter sp. Res13-Sevr-PEB04-36]